MLMSIPNQDNTYFITIVGLYWYKLMSFGLKSSNTTYQRAAMTIRHDLIHKEFEVYADDMIIKSKTQEGQIPILRKFLERL